MTTPTPSGAPRSTAGASSPAATVALYAMARLGLVLVITVALVLAHVPVLVAALVALVLALPLSMVLFRGLRSRVDGALAEVRERRAAERSALRARLRGDDVRGDDPDDADRAGERRDGADQPVEAERRDAPPV